MTEAEERGLCELSAELAGAEKSPWQPRCVCRAFAYAPGKLVLTMQSWINLEAIRSPLLVGKRPEGDTLQAQLSAAVDAFGIGPLEVTVEEAAELIDTMLDAVYAAFETQIKLRAPGASGPQQPGGCGDWLPVFSCLVAQIGMSRRDALATPVAQAFALIASHRINQGWHVVDATYAQRDIAELTGGQE